MWSVALIDPLMNSWSEPCKCSTRKKRSWPMTAKPSMRRSSEPLASSNAVKVSHWKNPAPCHRRRKRLGISNSGREYCRVAGHSSGKLESGMAETPITRRQAGQIISAAAATPLLTAQSSDICFLTAVEMAGLIRRKKLSAREVMAAHLNHTGRVNPKMNAILTLIAAQAQENARKADELQAKGAPLGPLHGLPIAHKDLVETAGIRTTFGSLIFKDYVPKEDAIIVERIKRAGAIVVGKTNTPEFGAGSQTFNRVFGATKNPYDLTRTCGGSSGGAAASLASELLPIADGSDARRSLHHPHALLSVVVLL